MLQHINLNNFGLVINGGDKMTKNYMVVMVLGPYKIHWTKSKGALLYEDEDKEKVI